MKRGLIQKEPLPPRFAAWFAARGWSPRAHQQHLLALAQQQENALLIAPTGAGKTLAGFLPSLVDLEQKRNRDGLHTLYISPLKALAVDVERNLQMPIAEMGLKITVETRTGDTSTAKRLRQRRQPPDMLLTTPEQLTLLLATADAEHLFADVRRVIFDELHAIAPSKRGDLLSLGLARLRTLAPMMRTTGLSATVRAPEDLQRWLVSQQDANALATLITAPPGAPADLRILDSDNALPWAGHSAAHALREIYAAIEAATMTLVFVNTRAQAEYVFQELWRINEKSLPIALHHGSLDAGQRRKVEAAMVQNRLKAVVCTSTLDLGIDWGAVDLVINVGAPKGASRLAQRIGRANHRLDEPSRALLVPANRFEVLECHAAVEAARAGTQDTAAARAGALDVLCQHLLGMACVGPFDPQRLYEEVITAAPYAGLSRKDFDAALNFAAHGGYALKAYERFAKLKPMPDGRWRIANGRVAQAYRMNCGTIVEADMLRVRLVPGSEGGRRKSGQPLKTAYTGPLRRGGRILGEIEDYFIETLRPKDTFLFGGEILALQGIAGDEALVVRSHAETPKIPSYAGGKFPLSTYLAKRVRELLSTPEEWNQLPPQVVEWLALQKHVSRLPPPEALLVETFARGGHFHLVAYPFEGRLAHQTLGMLLTRRMERAGLQPLGFVANDYALCVWSRADVGAWCEDNKYALNALFAKDMLGDDLEEWLHESALMKRTFRNCAIIAGLIERNFPGKQKAGRQESRRVTISTDLIYDVLRRHEPDHVLLRAARADAATGLLDLERLGLMLARVRHKIIHQPLTHISPLAVPIMLEIGRERVYGEAQDALLAEAAADLAAEAMAP
ncbi:ligase-associated DNA damage response DEXH box helicase [Beijerinckia indica]|uniref:DEAD/H associated domain protein n=1 Tax=Beijerinckia indica subsp. indica (strain ATCC 9039 / DSM 1715 / NCIMB 8712) TaxID=395963 RepID=B2IE02_BEII9|nr:ligase-associated DNA damage response DEXH box helicase [Beijerinckia indica]ACB94026.1 DEAD/H associated domain protein [Beijerinckia indica subsp. indica ATCC 9039]